MVLHSAAAFIYDTKEMTGADRLTRAALFVFGCMMIAEAEEFV